MKPPYLKNRMRGLSLIELMVALTIGLIILAAVSSLFVSSRQTYTTQDSLARLQENARFAMQFMMKDMRLAGYFGCLYDTGSVKTNTSGTPITNADGSIGSSAVKFNLTGGPTFVTNIYIPFEGIENAVAASTWLPSGTAKPTGIVLGTDAIAMRMADSSANASVAPGMLNESGALNVDNAASFVVDDIVMVADCSGGDVMQITAINGNALSHATGGTSPGNVTANLMKAYVPPDSATESPPRVFKLMTRRYYIGSKTVNGNTIPGLYRQDNNGVGQELVEGIENMQILLGVDTDTTPGDSIPDGIPNIFVSADNAMLSTPINATDPTVTFWSRVVSMRIGVLARTVDDKNVDVDNANYDVDGDGVDDVLAPGDRFRRRVFQTTVQLRNAWTF